MAYAGSATVADLALDDSTGVSLFGWKTLATDTLKASLSPNRVDIDELRLTAPVGRFAIAKDGTSNVSRAFAADPSSAGAKSPPPSAESAPRTSAQEAAPGAKEEAETGSGEEAAVAVAVRRVQVERGALDFSDASLSPEFVAKIVDLAGTANGLSSDREARSQFTLEGRVGEFGYARLFSGAFNPFTPRDRSTFRVQLRNMDLTTISPYAMRFAGYRIAAGRLALDLNYRVRASLIEGNNKITLDQFKLGERVESPDALKLPIELAVALLKDPDGTINLEVPVKGSLDPQFEPGAHYLEGGGKSDRKCDCGPVPRAWAFVQRRRRRGWRRDHVRCGQEPAAAARAGKAGAHRRGTHQAAGTEAPHTRPL